MERQVWSHVFLISEAEARGERREVRGRDRRVPRTASKMFQLLAGRKPCLKSVRWGVMGQASLLPLLAPTDAHTCIYHPQSPPYNKLLIEKINFKGTFHYTSITFLTTESVYKVNTKSSNSGIKLFATQLRHKKLVRVHAKSTCRLLMIKEDWSWAKMILGQAWHTTKWSTHILKMNKVYKKLKL